MTHNGHHFSCIIVHPGKNNSKVFTVVKQGSNGSFRVISKAASSNVFMAFILYFIKITKMLFTLKKGKIGVIEFIRQ